MRCYGLDVGSSSIKGAVLDLDSGRVESVVRTPFPAPQPDMANGFFEIAAAEITNAATHVLTSLLDGAPDAHAVFAAGQMGGVILVDDRGRPLTNYLSWRDQRTLQRHPVGASYCELIRQRWTETEFSELGRELQPGSATSLLFWLSENGQLPDRATPISVADFVLGSLCKTQSPMHPTQAIGLLHGLTRDWHQAALNRLGFDRLRWPRLATTWKPLGWWSIRGRRLPCYPAVGDQQCALRGVGLGRDELSLNVSTGSQVSRRTQSFVPGPYQTRAYFDGDYLNTITHLPAGRSLNVIVDLLTELARAEGVTLNHCWDTIATASAKSDPGGLRCNLAFFAGPMGSQGAIEGITTDNLTVGHLFHAAFLAMAQNYAACAERVWPEQCWKRIAVSGGLTRQVPVLRQMIERRFTAPLRESTATEETMLGLLDLARNMAEPSGSQAE